jgi:hypothetical protein
MTLQKNISLASLVALLFSSYLFPLTVSAQVVSDSYTNYVRVSPVRFTDTTVVPTAVVSENLGAEVVTPEVVVSDSAVLVAPAAPTVTVSAPPVVVSPAPSTGTAPTVVTTGVTCTKTISGTCILFSCTDGSKTNTCDLTCSIDAASAGEPALAGSVETDEPKITAVYPNTGNAGTIVKVYLTKGKKNFSGPDSIEVGGVPVKMKTFSNVPGSKADFVLEFVLPAEAKTGKVVIKKPGTFKNPAVSDTDFVVIPEQDAPTITEIKPLAGYAGQEVTLELFMGTKKFSGVDSVEIGGVPAKIISQSDVPSKKPNARVITFIVPEGAKTGKVSVTKMQTFGSVSSAQDFTVVPSQDAPTILSFSPKTGMVGDTVEIKLVPGKKSFSGVDGIYIGEKKAEIVSQYADTSGIKTLTITVPPDAKTGKIVVRKPQTFLDVTTGEDFVVQEKKVSFFQKIVNFFKKK